MVFKHVLVKEDTHRKLKSEAATKGIYIYDLVEQAFQNSGEVNNKI